MISIEQIRSLENKVHTAVSRIKTLAAENATLKQRLESYEDRISELQTLVSAFKNDQEEIEAGIVAALKHLDELEDTVSEPAAAATEEHPQEAPAPDVEPGNDAEPGNETEPGNDAEPEDEEPELDIF